MEEIISGDTRTTEEHAKHHLTLEEQLAQLEAKDKKAKETEARARGVSFSDFLRERLMGEQPETVKTAREKTVETAGGESAETVLSALRQIADFLSRMEQEQRESGYFTQRLVFNSLRVLAPGATEGRNKMWD